MKKLLFLIILLIPFIVRAEGVKITKIELDSKSINTTVNNEATFEGIELNLDLSFKTKDDYAKYKITVQNDTEKEYKKKKKSNSLNSDYIKYEYEYNEVIKPKSETILYLIVRYDKPVDPTKLVNNLYSETNTGVIELVNNEENPNTKDISIILISIVLILSIITIILLIKNKNVYKSTLLLLIISVIITPYIIKAIEELKLTMNVKIEIKQGYKVGYLIDNTSFYKKTDLAKYDLSEADCHGTIYIGEKKEENAYTICNGIIVLNEKLYSPGEQAELIEYDVITDINDNCDGISIFDFLEPVIPTDAELTNTSSYDMCESTCVRTEPGIYECSADTKLITRKIEGWAYNNRTILNDYPTSNDDKEIMNFTNLFEDNWEAVGEFKALPKEKFTMPNHNVLWIDKDTK